MTSKVKNPTDPSGNEPYKSLVHSAFNVFFDGWMLMLFLGVAHASARAIPALGYWQCLFGAWVFAGFCGSALTPVTERIKKLATLL